MEPKRDSPTVTPDGKSLQRLIEGVVIVPLVTHHDDRGELCEILNPHLLPGMEPIVWVYQFSIRPGRAKGWHQHHQHTDRIMLSRGTMKVVLFDDRPGSPTRGMVNVFHRSQNHRDLIVIPPFVWHAHANVGTDDCVCVSMPTRAYDHAAPDVFRLPLENDVIPYSFRTEMGR